MADDNVLKIDGFTSIGVGIMQPTPINLPVVGSLPPGDVLDTVTAANFQQQGSNLPSASVWQINNGMNQTLVQKAIFQADTSDVKHPEGWDATPQQVFNVEAQESPYKTTSGNLLSLISVDWEYTESDRAYVGAQMWIQGYHGSDKWQLISQFPAAPAQVLMETTKENITIKMVAIGATGKTADFEAAPTTTVSLDGVVSAPPHPSIAKDRMGLPNNMGWEFAYNIIGGLLHDVIDGYWIYKAEVVGGQPEPVMPTPPACRWKYYKQPTTNIGVQTVQDITDKTYVYWVSAVNTSGMESELVAVDNTLVTLSYYPSIVASGDNGEDISISPVSATLHSGDSHVYAGAYTPVMEGPYLGNTLIFNQAFNGWPLTNFYTTDGNTGAYKRFPYSWQQQDFDGKWVKDIWFYTTGYNGNAIGFQAVYTGSFIVKTPGVYTFDIICDDSWVFFVGGGATRQGGKWNGYMTSQSGYTQMGSDLSSANTIEDTERVAVMFPTAGVYPFEIGHGANGGSTNTYFEMTYEKGWDGAITKYQGGYGKMLRPMSYFADPEKAYNGNESDFCQADTTVSLFATQYWAGWKNPAGVPNGVKLTVMTSLNGTGKGILGYSVDNGQTWQTLYETTGVRPAQYDSVVLDPSTDFTKVMVSATSAGTVMKVYEMRLEATV